MRWVMIALAALVGLAVALLLIGMARPRGHVASTQATYARPPAEIWATLADFDRWSEWNPEVHAVERLPDRDGHRMLAITGSWGRVETEVAVVEPPARLETVMDAGDFRGSWTYELSPTADGGTLLTVTERGEVDKPLFRAFMLFMDEHATMVAFHRALAARLGLDAVEVTPLNREPGTRRDRP